MQLLVISRITCMMSTLLLLQPRGSMMLIENESFGKSYIYLLHVGKYSRQMLSVKLSASCPSLHAKTS